jgi:NADPH2:quinone reductase
VITVATTPAEIPEHAKAVRFDRYGELDVLYIADVPVPRPGPGQVLVAVRAAGINPGEASIRRGLLDAVFPATFPSGEGSDLAGVVVAVGDGIRSFAIGDDVMGWTDERASQAQYVVVPETQLIRKPANVSWEVAGSLFVAGVTAFAAVRAVNVKAGETVAVSGAAGGVGTIAVQLLVLKGAQVIGIASPSNHDWLRSLGATPVDYGADLVGRLREAAPSGIDAFIDTFGSDYVKLAVELGVRPDRIDTIAARDAAAEVGAKTEGSAAGASTTVLSELAELIASGQLDVPIAKTYPLTEVRDAYAELDKRHTHGKIVLIP